MREDAMRAGSTKTVRTAGSGARAKRWCAALLCLVVAPWTAHAQDAASQPAAAPQPKPAPSAAVPPPPLERNIDVLHYTVRLDPDLAAKSLHGRVEVDFVAVTPSAQALEFDAGELSIDAVRENGTPLVFTKVDKRLRVELRAPLRAGTRRRIEIDYHGAPRFGLEFHPERGELYTVFSTSQWMVCIDAPDERATLDLSVALPAGLKSVGTGNALPVQALDADHELHRWQQKVAIPSYIYGFAAGRYVETSARGHGGELRHLATGLDAEQLQRIFADTADILDFYGERAGIRYRGVYTQALVARTVGQELAGFALMSENYGQSVLESQTAESLIAHEAAHQWWGNMVTCRDWNHFWLNEGFATFMAAAYLQRRFGEEEYRKQVDGWKHRLDKLRASGTDHAVVYDRWFKPSADDRAVVYQKGAYVLHLLREQLGERTFWRGIRAYTRRHYGQSVTTADFRASMERASGRDLSAFFNRWIEGPGENAPVASMPAVDAH